LFFGVLLVLLGVGWGVFLQHSEHTHLAHLTHKHRIINYCRYVDDILLIHDSTHTSIQMILEEFNALHPKPQFTAEAEKDNNLNYLDISTHRTHTTYKQPYTGSTHSRTPPSPTSPTTPHNKNAQQSGSYSTD